MGAIISMRLLVVLRYPPLSSRRFPSCISTAP